MSEMQTGQEPITITLNDVATMVQIIDVVSRRGGIQGNEMAGVGMLRNKLEAFVQQNVPDGQEAADAAVGESGVDVDVPPLEGELASKVVQ